MRRPIARPSSIACLRPNTRAAEIADGGETTHQRALSFRTAASMMKPTSAFRRAEIWQSGEDRMPVRVDQARHEGPAAAVNCLRSGRRREIVCRQRLDPPALDEEAKSAFERARLAIEQKEIRESDGTGSLRRLRSRARRKAEGGERRAYAGDEAAPRQLAVDPPRNGADLWSAAATADGGDEIGAVVGWRARVHIGPLGGSVERPVYRLAGAARKKLGHDRGAPLFTIRKPV